MGKQHRRLGGSGKGPVLAVIAVVAFGVAGFLAYQHFSQQSAGQASVDKYEEGRAWMLRISREFARDESRRFQRVQLGVMRDESDKADHYIEIAGVVGSQADMDTLNTMLKKADLVPPIRHTFTVKVDTSTAAPATDAPAPAAAPAGGSHPG